MKSYDLTFAEDAALRRSVMFYFGRHSLYTYFCRLPLDTLRQYPQKGFHWWMGRAARSPKAMELQAYILHWRLQAQRFRKQYPRTLLETYSLEELRSFLLEYMEKVPLWPYEAPLRDAIEFLSR